MAPSAVKERIDLKKEANNVNISSRSSISINVHQSKQETWDQTVSCVEFTLEVI